MRADLAIPDGYEADGEWLVHASYRALRRRMLDETPPRAFGFLDQVRADVGSPMMLALYVVALGSFVYAAVTGRLSSAL